VGPAAAGGGCAPGPHGPATPHAEVATRATADGDGAAAAGVHDVDPPSSWQSPESPLPQSSATATCPQSCFQRTDHARLLTSFRLPTKQMSGYLTKLEQIGNS